MLQKPQLLFVAGPNGAGKSTFSKDFSEPGAVIFDADKVVARIETEFPGIPKKQLYKEATDEFFEQAKAAVRQRQHFTLETNFRDDDLVNIIDQFKNFGYATHMIYLTLESIEQSKSRVNERVSDGGHDVDYDTIKQNYDLGLQYLEKFENRFDHIEIVDATGVEGELFSLLSIQNRKLEYVSNQVPERVLSTIKAIAGKFVPPPLSPGPRRFRGLKR